MKKTYQVGLVIDEAQRRFLDLEARNRRMSKAEIIRQIVNDHMDQPIVPISPRQKTEKIQLRLYDDQAAHIKNLSQMSDLTAAEVIRILIDQSIDNNKGEQT